MEKQNPTKTLDWRLSFLCRAFYISHISNKTMRWRYGKTWRLHRHHHRRQIKHLYANFQANKQYLKFIFFFHLSLRFVFHLYATIDAETVFNGCVFFFVRIASDCSPNGWLIAPNKRENSFMSLIWVFCFVQASHLTKKKKKKKKHTFNETLSISFSCKHRIRSEFIWNRKYLYWIMQSPIFFVLEFYLFTQKSDIMA